MKILIINGHPDPRSFNAALAAMYKKGALESGAELEEIVVAALQFDPNLRSGYRKRMEPEPDLQEAWQKILRADHLVWVHPVWWGGLPALTKGFVDRLFLPGMAFRYRENSVFWDKLLKGRTARILTTLDQPGWYYRLAFGRPSVNQLRRSILEFCGIKPVKVTYFGIIRNSKAEEREKWLQKAYRLGRKMA
ncbi:MAG: NAD(P)H-dependent oxidoreductase [Bacteroidia bacterium]|nr:NAD(P)H-dependent oxidoreductase [Bacteroidia bacterium]